LAKAARAVWLGVAVAVAGIAAPPAGATNYVVRVGFEELEDFTYLTTRYLQYGIEFQDLGLDGTNSWGVAALPPFGGLNWSLGYVSYGMKMVVASPWPGSYSLNVRWITFTRPASRVTLREYSNQVFGSAGTKIRAYDGPNGTGTELFYLQMERGFRQLVDINTGNIRSITIQNMSNRAGIDELTVYGAEAPKGGNIVVTSTLDGATPPLVFLDGNPTHVGASNTVSPDSLFSISEGKHLVTLVAPGYEWYQQMVDVVTGQDAVVHAVMKPVTVPVLDGESPLQADGAAMQVGTNAAPCAADWDSDGRTDLLVGNASGDLVLFRNVGTESAPVFAAGVTVLTNLGSNASPLLLDFYEDEKNDLLVGFGDGSVKVYFNQGTRAVPDFSGSPYDSTLVTIPTSDAVPFLADWDHDGAKDLLVGGANGKVYLYTNQRVANDYRLTVPIPVDASPDYSGATSVVVAAVSSRAAPGLLRDWDGDGRKDLVVGDGQGYVNLLLNSGTDAAPVFTNRTRLRTEDGTEINAGSRARPLVGDFNADGRKDVLLGRRDGRVSLFTALAGPRLRVALTATNSVLVRWASVWAGYGLQQNNNLNTTNWVNAPAPGDDGTNKFVVVESPAESRFYRLFKE
jgi:hypothetical protein